MGLDPYTTIYLFSIQASPSSTGSKPHGFVKRDKNAKILEGLVDQDSDPRGGLIQYKGCGKSNRISWLDNKSRQIGVNSNSSVLFSVILIPPKLSPCKAYSGKMAKKLQVCPDCKIFYVAHWVASVNQKDGPGSSPSHETLLVAPQ